MAKRIVPFGTSETDELVMRYLARGPIKPTDVQAYTIGRADGHSVLTLTLFFQDQPAAVEVTGLDRAEREHLPIDAPENKE